MRKKDYTKFSSKNPTPIHEPSVIAEDFIESVEKVEPDLFRELPAHVNCPLLNVRVAPHPEADIVSQIIKTTKVLVYPAYSTDDFYKICTATGVEGYCMKKFIDVEE